MKPRGRGRWVVRLVGVIASVVAVCLYAIGMISAIMLAAFAIPVLFYTLLPNLIQSSAGLIIINSPAFCELWLSDGLASRRVAFTRDEFLGWNRDDNRLTFSKASDEPDFVIPGWAIEEFRAAFEETGWLEPPS